MADQDLDAIIKRMTQTRINRRSFLATSGLTASAAFLAACAPSGGATVAPSTAATPAASAPASNSTEPSAAPVAVEKELLMYNWSDYVDPDNMTTFQERFGVEKFSYDTFASNDELVTKLQGGAKGQWDISAPTAEFVPQLVDQGFIQKIDWSKVPNAKYIEAAFKGLWWDPKDEYQLPKDWGTTGIAVRTKIVKEEVKTWKAFLEVAPKYSGRIVLVDSPFDVFVAPLKALNYSINTVDPTELGEARKLLKALAPHVLALDSDQYHTKLASEEAVLGLVWTGNVLELRDKPETADVQYYIPEDGTLFWLDTWVIFAEPPHPEAAHAFLNFIQEPEIQAKETMTNRYATCNSEAKKFIDPALLADPAIFVPDDVLAKLEGAKDVSTDPLRIEIWEEFKSSIGS